MILSESAVPDTTQNISSLMARNLFVIDDATECADIPGMNSTFIFRSIFLNASMRYSAVEYSTTSPITGKNMLFMFVQSCMINCSYITSITSMLVSLFIIGKCTGIIVLSFMICIITFSDIPIVSGFERGTIITSEHFACSIAESVINS